MDRFDFTQGVVRTRVFEKRLLTKEYMNRMIEAENIEAIYKILNETEYESFIAKLENKFDYESILSNELVRVYDLMREVTADQSVIDLLALKYDYHNLKVMLKGKYLALDLSYLYIPIVTEMYKDFSNKVKENDFIDDSSEFGKAVTMAMSEFELNSDPQMIDVILDGYYYSHLYKMALSIGIDLFIEYVKDLIDFTNIKSSIRLRMQDKGITFCEKVILPNGNIDKEYILNNINVPIEELLDKYKDFKISSYLIKGLDSYENTKSLTEFEKCIDNYLTNLIKKSKNITFGPEPIFAYVLAKEVEIKNLRLIMISKINNITPEVTNERLRDLYV